MIDIHGHAMIDHTICKQSKCNVIGSKLTYPKIHRIYSRKLLFAYNNKNLYRHPYDAIGNTIKHMVHIKHMMFTFHFHSALYILHVRVSSNVFTVKL